MFLFFISLAQLNAEATNKVGVGSTSSSLEADISNKVFDIGLSNGSGLFGADIEKRRSINQAILEEGIDQKVSLYDRFGGNVYFVPYFGEKKYSLSLVDTFYDQAKENNEDFSFNLDQLLEKREAQIFNEVYENRPVILNESEISAGKVDPRRSTYSFFSNSGGDAAVGNFYLTLAKITTDFVGFMSGAGLYDMVEEAWNSIISSGFYSSVSSILLRYYGIFVAIFVISLAFSVFKIMTQGEESLKEVLSKSLNFLLASGVVFTLAANPNLFGTISSFAINAIDGVFTSTLSSESNEIAASDDGTYVIEANLWAKSILEPWSKGMFDGRTYEELHTQFSTVQDELKLPQSKDDIFSDWSGGGIRYSSANLTGDISVPLGDREIKNWAALAWSTQSLFHIDAVRDSSAPSRLSDGVSWPVARRTAKNPNIYIDNFRWLDAKLNISPGYLSPSNHDNNYVTSNAYEHNFTLNGLDALFRSLLMLPIVYPIIRRLLSLMMVISIGFRWMIRSFGSLLKPNDSDYSLNSNLKKIWRPVYIYFWWSLVSFILIIFYVALIGSALGNILWILSAYVICKFKPVENTRQIRELKVAFKKNMNKAKKQLKNMLPS